MIFNKLQFKIYTLQFVSDFTQQHFLVTKPYSNSAHCLFIKVNERLKIVKKRAFENVTITLETNAGQPFAHRIWHHWWYC